MAYVELGQRSWRILFSILIDLSYLSFLITQLRFMLLILPEYVTCVTVLLYGIHFSIINVQ